MYNVANCDEVVETFARYASDPELSFGWYDAAVLTQRVRREQRQAKIAAARALLREALGETDDISGSNTKNRSRRNALHNVGLDFFEDLDD